MRKGEHDAAMKVAAELLSQIDPRGLSEKKGRDAHEAARLQFYRIEDGLD